MRRWKEEEGRGRQEGKRKKRNPLPMSQIVLSIEADDVQNKNRPLGQTSKGKEIYNRMYDPPP